MGSGLRNRRAVVPKGFFSEPWCRDWLPPFKRGCANYLRRRSVPSPSSGFPTVSAVVVFPVEGLLPDEVGITAQLLTVQGSLVVDPRYVRTEVA